MRAPAASGVIAGILAGALLPAVAGAQSGLHGEDMLILDNGRIWTNDPAMPEARGLVVIDGRVAHVIATDEAFDVPHEGSHRARVIDLRGRRVVPGFNDAHTHLFDGGETLLSPNLLESDTPEALVRKLGEYVATVPPGRWIDLNAAWDHQRWPDRTLPSRHLIDPVTPDNPVWMRRPDGHVGLANSRALELAGITAETPDPPGGQIDRDPETGEPTGILRDAGQLIWRVMPGITEDVYRERLDAVLAHAARIGVTSVQDMCYEADPHGIRLLQEYAREGRLTVRVYCLIGLGEWTGLRDVGISAPFGDGWVRIGALKSYADGALGSSTAYFFEPYVDDPGSRGLLSDLMDPPEKFWGLISGADVFRLQLAVHAIGDAAISQVLDHFDRIRRENPEWDRRLRIEHAQHMASKDFARMAEMGVVASVQPFHAIDDGRWAERKIGFDRARTTYPFRSFLDAGVPMAFGTDWPVAPLDPMRTVYAAVTRRTLEGAHPAGWVPEQKISVEEALRAYTSGSAHAEFTDHEKGRLKAGYLADFVVLSEDPLGIPAERLEAIHPVMTVVGGRIVYEAEGRGE